eukprot:jgi/Botrbrau1/10859/Bobra.0025s0037.1
MLSWRGGSSKDDYRVHEFRTLGKSEDAKAKRLLEDIAWHVQPVMMKRKWQCACLSEFTPKNSSLRGINYGGGDGKSREIKLRLRQVGDEKSFYDFEDLLLVMLHELAHNVFGPHNQDFYKLLDEITAECQEFKAKGIGGTGQGFDAPAAGKSGGKGFGAHNADLRGMRVARLKAAEERQRVNSIMPKGARRLGGDSRFRMRSPKEAAAAAAMRREEDNRWCPCETHQATLKSSAPCIPEAEPEDDPSDLCPMQCSPQKSGHALADSTGPRIAGALGDGLHSQAENKKPGDSVCDLTMDSDPESGIASSPGPVPVVDGTVPHEPSTAHKKRSWFRKTSSPKKSPDSPTGPVGSATSLERPSKRLQMEANYLPTAQSLDVDDMDISPGSPGAGSHEPLPPVCGMSREGNLPEWQPKVNLRVSDHASNLIQWLTGKGRDSGSGTSSGSLVDHSRCVPSNGKEQEPVGVHCAGDDGACEVPAPAGSPVATNRLMPDPQPVCRIDKGKAKVPDLQPLIGMIDSDDEDPYWIGPTVGPAAMPAWNPMPHIQSIRDLQGPSGLTREARHIGMFWTCERCTFFNKCNTTACAMCETPCPMCAAEAEKAPANCNDKSCNGGATQPGGERQSVLSRWWKSPPDGSSPLTTQPAGSTIKPSPIPANEDVTSNPTEKPVNPFAVRRGRPSGGLMGFKVPRSQGQRLLVAAQQQVGAGKQVEARSAAIGTLDEADCSGCANRGIPKLSTGLLYRGLSSPPPPIKRPPDLITYKRRQTGDRQREAVAS